MDPKEARKIVESSYKMASGGKEMSEMDAVLVRYGEIGIKSDRVRSRYERTLIENIRGRLNFCEVSYDTIVRDFGRIFVHTQDSRAALAIASVFGVVSVSPVQTSSSDLDRAASDALRIVSPLLKGGRSFGIRARRTGTHDYSSKDIGVIVGSKIVEATNAPVKLSAPDVQLFIDVRQSRAYLYTRVIQGVGGLPLGTQGKVVALISGGIDSPVAAWLMMKRGCTIIPLFFDCGFHLSDTAKQRALEVVRALAVWAGTPLNLARVSHESCLSKFNAVSPRMTCVLCKRMMYRVASSVAKQEAAHGIVTGESIGQVASQTTHNLMAINDAADVPIYRPLIGLDKTEIIHLARRIGTYRLSTAGDSVSCTAAPAHPTTSADPYELKRQEAQLYTRDLSIQEAESISWNRISPDRTYRWILSQNKSRSN